jgi:hypothetical protein
MLSSAVTNLRGPCGANLSHTLAWIGLALVACATAFALQLTAAANVALC